MMICPKCKSTYVTVQTVNEVNLQKKKKSMAYWLFIGWWLEPTLWLFFTLPMLIITIFKPKKYKTKNKVKTICVCQNCGNTWNA